MGNTSDNLTSVSLSPLHGEAGGHAGRKGVTWGGRGSHGEAGGHAGSKGVTWGGRESHDVQITDWY